MLYLFQVYALVLAVVLLPVSFVYVLNLLLRRAVAAIRQRERVDMRTTESPRVSAA